MKHIKEFDEFLNEVDKPHIDKSDLKKLKKGDSIKWYGPNGITDAIVVNVDGIYVAIENLKNQLVGTIPYQSIVKESVNYDQDSNTTYFRTAAMAADFARKMAEKKGYEVDDRDWAREIGFGGKYNRLRPSVGKTHSFSIGLTKGGKPQKKALHISIYGMKAGNFELTTYIS